MKLRALIQFREVCYLENETGNHGALSTAFSNTLKLAMSANFAAAGNPFPLTTARPSAQRSIGTLNNLCRPTVPLPAFLCPIPVPFPWEDLAWDGKGYHRRDRIDKHNLTYSAKDEGPFPGEAHGNQPSFPRYPTVSWQSTLFSNKT